MAVSLGPALWMDGPTYDSETIRQLDVGATWFTQGTADALSVRGGVINNSTGSLQVLAVSGMSIKVAAGFAIVPNSATNIEAAYKIGSMTSNALTVDTADATNPRIDLVTIYIVDNGDYTSSGYIDITEGTPAASPVPPTAPDNSVVLATVAVAANTTSISTANITDQRVYTTAAGGVVPWPTLTGIPAGHAGLIAYDTTNSRFFHNDASGADQLATLPWQPQVATRLVNGAIPLSTPTTWMSVNITTDGHTDIKVTLHWNGVFQETTLGFQNISFQTYLDTIQLDQVSLCTMAGTKLNAAYNGGTSVYSTSSVTGDTPSAGSHVVYFKFYYETGGSGSQPWVFASTGSPATLRVEPVVK